MSFKLHPYQKDAVDLLRSGAVLIGDVGSGKSITSIAYFFKTYLEAGKPRDLYVITTAKKRDDLEWELEAARFGLDKDAENNQFGISVIVDSWNNIGKYKEVKDAFFIFDEQRLVGSGAWVKSFYRIARGNPWILLTATPADTWMDMVPVFVANGFFKNKTEFTREHVIYNNYAKYPKVDRYVNTGRLLKYRNQICIPMRDSRTTRRVEHDVTASYGTATYDRVVKQRWNVFEDVPCTDISDVIRVARRVLCETSNRDEHLSKISERHRRVIVFYNFNYELDLLRAFAEERGLTYAEWNGHKHDPIPDVDVWLYFVQYTAGSEGWNCITTDCVVFYSPSYSYRAMYQARGRIDRINTPFRELHYYTMRTTSGVDVSILKALKEKRTFNERKDFKC